MKHFLIFIMALSSNLFAQDTTCTISISQGQDVVKGNLDYRKINLGKHTYHDYKLSKDIQFNDNLYSSAIRKDGNDIDIKIYRDPIEDKTQLQTGLRVELHYNEETQELEVSRIRPYISSTEEEYFLFTTRKIQTEGKVLNLEFDNNTNDKISISCTIPTLEGAINYIKNKNNKSKKVAPIDNSGNCTTKVSELKVSTDKIMSKSIDEPNYYQAVLETTNQDIKYEYDTKVKLNKGVYTVEALRHSGTRSVMNPGSLFKLTLTLNQDTEILEADISHTRFQNSHGMKSEQGLRNNKFTVSKLYKEKESDSLYIVLVRDSSKLTISCTSSEILGSINFSELEITDENHEQFINSISTNQRSEIKEVGIKVPSETTPTKVLDLIDQ